MADLHGSFPALSRKGSGSQGQVLNSPSTGRKSSLNEAVSGIGHAVRAHQSSHPLIRLQYFQHPFTGKKQRNYNRDKTGLWRCDCDVISEATLETKLCPLFYFDKLQ